MIAFLDMICNNECASVKKRTDWDIIEIALIVKDSVTSPSIVASWSTYVKPVKTNGHVRKRIAQITGITQEKIDLMGIDREDALVQFENFITTYNVEKVYFYGSCAYALRANYGNKIGKKLFSKILCYTQDFFRQEGKYMSFVYEPSFVQLKYAYNYLRDDLGKHSALQNAEDYADFVYHICTSAPLDDNLREVNVYMDISKSYRQLKYEVNTRNIAIEILLPEFIAEVENLITPELIDELVPHIIRGIENDKTFDKAVPFLKYIQISHNVQGVV